MNLNKYIEKISQIKLDRKKRLILLVLYASIMISTIMSEINTLVFITLFVIVPLIIYLLVKMIFPKDK